MSVLFRAATFLVAALTLTTTGAGAQSYQDFLHRSAAQGPTLPDAVDPNAKAGDTIYVSDANGQIATITLGTYALHRIGYSGAPLTDIGFDPKDGNLYGISFGSFYRIDRTTAKATFIGNLGISDANALVFDATGKAYTEGGLSPELYTINVKNGHVSPIGSTAPYSSAGDLTFYNGALVLSAVSTTEDDTLVELNYKTGKPIAYSALKLENLYGLASTGKNLLFGFAGTSLYQLFPAETTTAKRAVLLKNFSGKGLAQIYGAAYDGYFQN